MIEKKIIIKYFLYTVVLLIILIPIFISLFNSPIYCDSSYYISIAERIYDGYIPYKNIKFGYTPLWFYIIYLFKTIFFIPNGVYIPYLIIHYIFLLTTSYILFLLYREFNIERKWSIICSVIYILLSIKCQGDCVLLEIPSVFWGMLSCLLILKYKCKHNLNFIWIGVICCCSFLTKQFGIGFLPLGLYLIVCFITRDKVIKLLFLLLGFSLPIIFCFLYWGENFIPLIISKYGTISAREAGIDTNLYFKLEHILRAIIRHLYKINPIVIFSFCFLPQIIKQNRLKYYLFSICGLGFILQFYFTPFSDHYQLYTLPFSVTIIALLLNLKIKILYRYIIYIIVTLTMLYANYRIYYNCAKYIRLNEKYEQIELSKWVNENTSEGKNIYIINSKLFSVYLLSEKLPPNLNSIGYSFGPLGLNEEKCRKQIESADYVLCYTKEDPYEVFYTDDLKTLCEDMSKVYYNNDIVLYINNK